MKMGCFPQLQYLIILFLQLLLILSNQFLKLSGINTLLLLSPPHQPLLCD